MHTHTPTPHTPHIPTHTHHTPHIPTHTPPHTHTPHTHPPPTHTGSSTLLLWVTCNMAKHRVISDHCDSLRHDPHKGIDGDDIECSIQQNRRNQSNSKDDQRTNDLCQNPLPLSLHGQKEQLLCEEGRGRGSIQLEVVAAHSSKDPQMLHEGCTQTLGQPQADQFQSAPTAHCTKRNGLHSNKVTRPHPLTRDHELGTLWLCPLYQVYIPASSQDGTPAQQSLIPRP